MFVTYVICIDIDNSELQHTLQKLNTEWQFNKELTVTEIVLSEQHLIQLIEKKHFLQGGDVIPYYQLINRQLLEMANSGSILGLLDVNVEVKDEQNCGGLLSFSSRETSAVTYLISNAMSSPSGHVSSLQSVL